MPRHILVTGASVAGNTLAYWLGRRGFRVTVVERAPAFRDGGQNVDVRGVGRTVLARMDLERSALDHGTGEQGTAWVDDRGRPIALFPGGEGKGDGPTAELEILRGDLAQLLFAAAQPFADFRFGDHVTAVDQRDGGVAVTFASGAAERYDALVVAEGVGSSTRALLMPGANDPRWMDLTIAYFTVPRIASDDRLWRWYNAPGGRGVSLRPDRHGTTRAMLFVQGPAQGEQDWPPDRQKAWLKQRFADAGWQTPRLLAALDDTDDFYFDALRQVRLPRWSTGQAALTGDAAWCVTPLAGIGTTLAVTGAYVLAAELARHDAITAGFAAYERVMRPMVEEAQGVPKLAPRLMNPHSRLAIALLHAALRLASLPPLRAAASRLFARPPREPDLSAYADPPAAS